MKKIESSELLLRKNYEITERMNALNTINRKGIFLIRNNLIDIEETRKNILKKIKNENPLLSHEEIKELVDEELKEILYKHYRTLEYYIFYLELPKYLGKWLQKEDVHKFFEQDLDIKFFNWLKEKDYSDSYIVSIFDPRENAPLSYISKSFISSAIPVFTMLQRIFFYSEFAKHMFSIIKKQDDEISTKECAEKVMFYLKLLFRKTDKITYESFDGFNFFLKIKPYLREEDNDPFLVNIKDYFLKSTIELESYNDIKFSSTTGIDLLIGNGILSELKYACGLPGYSYVYRKTDKLKIFEKELLDDFVCDFDLSKMEIVLLSKIYEEFGKGKYKSEHFASNTGIISTFLLGVGSLFTGQSTKLTIDEMDKILFALKLIFHAATGYSTNFGLFKIKDEEGKSYNPAENYVNIKRVEVEDNNKYFKIKFHNVLNVINKANLNEKFKQDFGEEAQAYYTGQSNQYGKLVLVYSSKSSEFLISTLNNFNKDYVQENGRAKILALYHIPTKYPLYQIQIENKQVVSVTTKELVETLYSPKGEETLLENGIGLNTWSRIRVINENGKLIPVLILQDKDGNIIREKQGKTIYWKLFSPLNYDRYTEFEGMETQIVSLKDELDDVTNTEYSNLKMLRKIAEELDISVEKLWAFISDSALKFSKYLRNRNVLAFEIESNEEGDIIIDKNHMTIDDAIIELRNCFDIIVKGESIVEKENLLNDEYTIIEKIKNFFYPTSTELTDEIITELVNIFADYIKELERLKEMTTLFNPHERINKLIYSLNGICEANSPISASKPESVTQYLDDTLNPLGYLVAFLEQEQGKIKEEEIKAIKNERKEYRYQVDIIAETILPDDDNIHSALTRKNAKVKGRIMYLRDLAKLLDNLDNLVINENIKTMFGEYKGEKGELRRIIDKILRQTDLINFMKPGIKGFIRPECPKIYNRYINAVADFNNNLKEHFKNQIMIIPTTNPKEHYYIFVEGLRGQKFNRHKFVSFLDDKQPPTIRVSLYGHKEGEVKELFKLMKEITTKDLKNLMKNIPGFRYDYEYIASNIQKIIKQMEEKKKVYVKFSETYNKIDYLFASTSNFGNTYEKIGMTIEILNSIIALAYVKAAESENEKLMLTQKDISAWNTILFKLQCGVDATTERAPARLYRINQDTTSRHVRSLNELYYEDDKILYSMNQYSLIGYKNALKLVKDYYIILDNIFGIKEDYLDASHYVNYPEDIQSKKINIQQNIKMKENEKAITLTIKMYMRIWAALTVELSKY